MASKLASSSYAGPGTKPGLHGLTLVSTGQAEVDRLLGGGLPLGTVLVILEDAFTQHHLTFLKYFIAEGVACGQAVHWASADSRGSTGGEGCSAEDALRDLPQIVEKSASEAEAEAPDTKDEQGLRIAWQYRRYIQDRQKAPEPAKKGGSAFRRKTPGAGTATAGVRDWCHSFNLTKPMKPPADSAANLERPRYQGASAMSSMLEAAEQWVGTLTQAPQNNPATEWATPEAQRDRLALQVAELKGPSDGGGEGGVRERKPVRRLMTSMAGRNERSELGAASLAGEVASGMESGAADGKDSPVGNVSNSQTGATAPASVPPRGGHDRTTTAKAVGRLAIQSLGSHQWGWEEDSRESTAEVLRTVHRLKALARKGRVAVVLTVPAGLHAGGLAIRLQHACDAAIILAAVHDDSDIVRIIPDPKSCCGTLKLTKAPRVNSLALSAPQTPLYLIRNRRARLALQPFEVDPDAEAALAASDGQGSANPQTASLLCGGPPKADNKALDF